MSYNEYINLLSGCHSVTIHAKAGSTFEPYGKKLPVTIVSSIRNKPVIITNGICNPLGSFSFDTKTVGDFIITLSADNHITNMKRGNKALYESIDHTVTKVDGTATNPEKKADSP